MYRLQSESFVVQIKGGEEQVPTAVCRSSTTLSSMKLFDRFRKILMRFVFSLPSARSVPRHRSTHADRPEPPKTSCSSYHYSPNSHYNEAIADCIEFFNKSSQDGTFVGRKSDVLV
ncbi:hypothetical protein IFM89_001180 [Coptis chinensis]|uniref:Uncharacterized protein n=1 Tax=Coptis chinensis TaxID=261450 RepID=A0A835M6Q9_9MAGN|nr:hypothetical protein IFM89_001180 [Coptis chinensis]